LTRTLTQGGKAGPAKSVAEWLRETRDPPAAWGVSDSHVWKMVPESMTEMFPERRFASTAVHYLVGRPPYAPALIARVVQLCRVTSAHRVLALGCGPGQLAVAFARYAGAVVAGDPELEMLRAARAAAVSSDAKIEFIEASSTDIGPAWGTFRLAVGGLTRGSGYSYSPMEFVQVTDGD
jgi:SAM-dependent methyltransferase